jgi:hypothetical protein
MNTSSHPGASRIDKNVSDIRAIGYDVKIPSAAVAGERKAITCPGKTSGEDHHGKQKNNVRKSS